MTVIFSEPIGPEDSLSHRAPSNLFHFKPSIKGEAWWTNGGRTLEYRPEKGAVYQIRLSFKKEYSLYGQDDYERGIEIPEENGVTESDNAQWNEPRSYYYYDDLDWDEYNWAERDDPTKSSYYMCSNRFPKYNLAASNIGLIVKSSDRGRLWTAGTELFWHMDGDYLGSTKDIHKVQVTPEMGRHTVTVMDSDANVITVEFTVK